MPTLTQESSAYMISEFLRAYLNSRKPPAYLSSRLPRAQLINSTSYLNSKCRELSWTQAFRVPTWTQECPCISTLTLKCRLTTRTLQRTACFLHSRKTRAQLNSIMPRAYLNSRMPRASSKPFETRIDWCWSCSHWFARLARILLISGEFSCRFWISRLPFVHTYTRQES